MSASFHFWETRLVHVAAQAHRMDSSLMCGTIVLHHNTFCCKALHILDIGRVSRILMGLNRNVDIFGLAIGYKSFQNCKISIVRSERE